MRKGKTGLTGKWQEVNTRAGSVEVERFVDDTQLLADRGESFALAHG